MVADDAPEGNGGQDPNKSILALLRLSEAIVQAYWQSFGLWYWLYPRYNHAIFFYPVLTLIAVGFTVNGVKQSKPVWDAAVDSGKGLIVIVVATLISQIIDVGWPRPADKLENEPEQQQERRQWRRNLATTFVLVVLLSLAINDIFASLGVNSLLTSLVPGVVFRAHFFLENIYEASFASIGAIAVLWLAEKIRRRKSASSRTLHYVFVLWLFATIATAVLEYTLF